MYDSLSNLHPDLKVSFDTDLDAAVEQQERPVLISERELSALMTSQFEHMFDVFEDGIFYMSGIDRVFLCNAAFYSRFGISETNISLTHWLDLVHPDDRQVFSKRVEQHLQKQQSTVTTQYRLRTTDGEYVWLEATAISKVIDGRRFMVGCHKDISEKKLLESFLQQASFKDTATGLSNINKLKVDVEKATDSFDTSHSLAYIQINNLRTYQTMYGSQIMRDLLTHFSGELQKLPSLFVDMYRVRTEEFAILVKGTFSNEEFIELGTRIAEIYQESVRVTGFLYGNEVSVGIYPEVNALSTPDEIIETAARTSHFARKQSHSSVAIYAGDEKKSVDRYFYIERELGNAIANGTLTVKFQPIICTRQNRVSSFEALVRWRSKDLGEIYPDEFISVAERKGLIGDLGNLVFEKACSFLHQYHQNHSENVRVNVNVSVLQLLNNRFPDELKTLTDLYNVSPTSIVLELTETIILDDNQHAVDQLNRLKDIGFRLALDDFGAGYSSLNSFFDLPLAQIKIDKSTAWRSFENPATFEYLTFVIQLCNSYAVDIVVEGIESADMQRVFTDMGAAYLQGYWFSKPLSLASASQYTQV